MHHALLNRRRGARAAKWLTSPALFLAACANATAGSEGNPSKTSANPPATVSNRVTEAELTTLTLTPEAVARLAIKTVEVRPGTLPRRRLFGGETLIPPGKSIQLSAPFAGTIAATSGGSTPAPGAMLKAGESILRLLPSVMAEREVLAPAERIAAARATADFIAAEAQAQGEASAARVQLQAAQINLDRTERLRKENATSDKILNEARAEHEIAKARLAAAEARAAAWVKAARGMNANDTTALELIAPFDGLLADLSAAPGEAVGAGAQIARFVSMDPLWVRVPIYVGSAADLDPDGEVRIGALDGRPRQDEIKIERIAGLPTADPMSASSDLYFRLDNANGAYRPQQRLGVWIPIRQVQAGLIVPWSAILYDIHGGAWVYDEIRPGKYVRRHVELVATKAGEALVSRGLRPGTRVVTDGAAELFGVEFGAGK